MDIGKGSCCVQEVLRVERNNDQFRILTEEFRTDWISENSSNQKAIVILLRLLRNKKDILKWGINCVFRWS